MERRRLLDLPSEYTRLNYIQPSGNARIDTEVYYNVDDLTIKGDFLFTENSNRYYPFFLGYEGLLSTNGRVCFVGFNFSVNPAAISFCNTYTSQSAFGMNFRFSLNTWYNYEYRMKNGSLVAIVDGTTVAPSVSYTFFNVTSKSIPIFTAYSPYTNEYRSNIALNSKVSYFQFIKSGVLIRDFVAAQRNADGVVGMYDLCGTICPLTGTPFYINAGSGTFIGG